MRGIAVSRILRPLSNSNMQSYVGVGLHTLGILGWILEQTGKADVYVTTFSTSDAFLSGFLRLKNKGLISRSMLVADLKASRKTMALYRLMQSCFDKVCLCMNHSKIVLVQNEKWTVSVISSQNQTYGDRAECTFVTTDQETFLTLYSGLAKITDKSILLNELFKRLAERDREKCEGANDSNRDLIPFGY